MNIQTYRYGAAGASPVGILAPLALSTSDAGTTWTRIINVYPTIGVTADEGKGTYDAAQLVSAPLTVSGTSETTSKGVRRVMLKVSLPYSSLTPSSVSAGKARLDPTKSGALMSMHVVLTVPKEACADIVNQDPEATAVGQRSVVSQILLLKYLLTSLMTPAVESTNTGLLPEAYSSNQASSATRVVTTNPILVNQSGVIQVAYVGPAQKSPSVDADPFVRGANGLKPLTDDRSYGVGSAA